MKGMEYIQPNQQSDILSKIKGLEQEIYQGGNVDVEKDAIAQIMSDLNNKIITPQQALLSMQTMANSRQEYH